jgi:hypothetical protein
MFGHFVLCACPFVFEVLTNVRLKVLFPSIAISIDGDSLTVFFPQILQCSQIGDHPQEDLATFVWTPDMKVKTCTKPFIFWLPARTCCKNLAILFKTKFKICQIRPIFSTLELTCMMEKEMD